MAAEWAIGIAHQICKVCERLAGRGEHHKVLPPHGVASSALHDGQKAALREQLDDAQLAIRRARVHGAHVHLLVVRVERDELHSRVGGVCDEQQCDAAGVRSLQH